MMLCSLPPPLQPVGRPTGEAYVVLSPSSDVQACFTQLDKKYIGRRYIE
jgi:hypothetical protein